MPGIKQFWAWCSAVSLGTVSLESAADSFEVSPQDFIFILKRFGVGLDVFCKCRLVIPGVQRPIGSSLGWVLQFPWCGMQQLLVEVNIACCERGNGVCSLREGGEVMGSDEETRADHWDWPHLRTDLSKGEMDAQVWSSFYTSGEQGLDAV